MMPEGSKAGSDRNVRLFALCGVIAPILFTILVFTAAFLRPGYSHVAQFISELGFGPNAIVQNANFVLTGLLIIAFAYGLPRGISEGTRSRKGPALVAAFGVGLIGAGIFPGDPASLSIQAAHSIFATVALVAGAAAPLAMAGRLRKDPIWHGYSTGSSVLGIAALILLFVLYGGVFGTGSLAPWKGAIQRPLFAIQFLWIEVMAIKLYKASRIAR